MTHIQHTVFLIVLFVLVVFSASWFMEAYDRQLHRQSFYAMALMLVATAWLVMAAVGGSR